MLKKALTILFSLVAVFMLFPLQEAGAVADGNGVCSPEELANFDCGRFGPNVIEFRGASAGTCVVNSGPGTAPCTVYFYLYTGLSTNQVNVAIPLNLNQVLNDAVEIDCSQYYTNGSGDPTTGFGKNMLTLGICRTANNLSSLPVINNDPGTWNLWIATDPSFPDRKEPLSWQLKQGRDVYAASIVGPVASQPPVFESGASLTTSEGKTISYTLSGDQVIITSNNADVVPMDKTKLCISSPPAVDPNFFPNPGEAYRCETISFVTEQCDVKTTGSDPCRYIGGRCILY